MSQQWVKLTRSLQFNMYRNLILGGTQCLYHITYILSIWYRFSYRFWYRFSYRFWYRFTCSPPSFNLWWLLITMKYKESTGILGKIHHNTWHISILTPFVNSWCCDLRMLIIPLFMCKEMVTFGGSCWQTRLCIYSHMIAIDNDSDNSIICISNLSKKGGRSVIHFPSWDLLLSIHAATRWPTCNK